MIEPNTKVKYFNMSMSEEKFKKDNVLPINCKIKCTGKLTSGKSI